MNQPSESPQDAFRSLAGANQALLEDFLRKLPVAGGPDFGCLAQAFSQASETQRASLRAIEERLYREHLALWRGVIERGDAGFDLPGDVDHRFDAPEWRELPFFRYLRAAYLLNTRFLIEFGQALELDASSKRRLQFVLRQIIDAAAPTNFAATNPEVIKLAAESAGKSLTKGMQLLAGDMARGRISMTDESAFEVGRNLAITPGMVVLENDVMQLIQYAPSTDRVRSRPLLIVPPFINKYYILDLQPENSFVRFCVEQGFTTFIVSWRNIPPELGRLGWEDYIEQGVFAPIEAARAITAADRVNALGFCVGGTLLASALAVLAQREEMPVASLTLLAAMLDFSETGDISVYIDRDLVARAEEDFREGGLMPGSRLASAFATLRANELIWHFVINSYLKGREPKAFDLLHWNADGSNLPGRLYAFYLRNMYLENNLRVPGKLVLCGVPVDLGHVRLPAYILAAREDHIVPWKAAYESISLMGGRSEFVLAASGHVAGVINSTSKNRRNYWVARATPADPDDWLVAAAQEPGSWWWHWAKWLVQHAGEERPAPTAPGNARYPAIEPAPGRYVKTRFD